MKNTNRYADAIRDLAAVFVYDMAGHTSVPITEAQITEVERKIGARLPEDYREFLHDYGGFFVGNSVWLSQQTQDGEEIAVIGAFYGIMPDDQYDLLNRYFMDRQILPEEVITIASGDNGYICLAIAGSKKGSVYFWNSREGDALYSYNHLYQITSTFDDFVQLLRSDK